MCSRRWLQIEARNPFCIREQIIVECQMYLLYASRMPAQKSTSFLWGASGSSRVARNRHSFSSKKRLHLGQQAMTSGPSVSLFAEATAILIGL